MLCSIIGCQEIATEQHHILGRSSPLTILVCRSCHGLIHDTKWRSDHAYLVKEGLDRARARGSIGGNPGILARDPEAIRKVNEAREAALLARLLADSATWLPAVTTLRPKPWREISLVTGQSAEKMRRSVIKLVKLGLADAALMNPTPHTEHKREPSERKSSAIREWASTRVAHRP